ncbi:hypothetical protein [Fundicoccus culcitae]|uniref:Cytochrome-c oxidase n=1 Tax=Fundicoccus culcitae TaxID=2969821 RepID=A0ABY5P2G2_9LACT|nr:hypothetical protein [Fundicoccus culcitae]UUX32901.1 hypothetical protein NRE15_08200 [Fundicoccus culcitae]
MSANFIKMAVVYFIIGVGLGLYMGAVEQFELGHAHAHINLLGWVSLALSGLIYKAYPALSHGKLSLVHFWGLILGTPFLTAGMALIGLERFEIGVPIAMIGGLAVLVGVLAFVINVFKHVSD